MGEPVTSSTPDTTAAIGPTRDLQEEEEEDEISAMQRSIQEDLPAEFEGEGAGHRTSIDSIEEIRQYIVYVEDDGTILLDKTGIMPADADPSCVIPLRLPVNKLADPEDPLPGAIHMSYRKTSEALAKRELPTLMYNADTDEVIGGATQLEEGDLEWVQINQKGDSEEGAQILPEEIKEEPATQALEPIPEPEPTVAPATTTIPPSETTEAPPDQIASPIPTPVTTASTSMPDTAAPKRASESQKSAQVTASATAARARRSLRQADRAEKQEAERILAENKQMLQREKEEMENLKPKLPLNTVTPSGHIVGVGIAPPSKKEQKEVVVDVEDSTKKNPKRTRKLPAHLTDPNYIHPLDDQSEDPDLKFFKEEEEEETEPDPEADTADEGDDVDDPNKLWCICRRPHNNRFMIQCDSCEDWFHGKCVGVTKAQGKVIEESEMQWHCPSCKKKLKEQEARSRLADKKARASGKTPESVKGGRNSTSSRENESARDKKGDQIPRRPSTFSPDITSLTAVRKDKNSTVAQKDDLAKKGKSAKSKAICIVCGNVARNGSEFCSNKCVMEKAKMNTPEEQEKKKELEKKESAGDSFLSFHKLKAPKKEDDVVSSSTEKSSKSPGAKKPAVSNTKPGIVKQTSKDSPLAKGSALQKLSNPAGEPKKSISDSSQPVEPIEKAKNKPEDAGKLRKRTESQDKERTQKVQAVAGKLKEALTQEAKGSTQKVPVQKQKSVEERNSQSQNPPQQKKVAESQNAQRDPNKKTSDGKARDSAKISTGTLHKSGSSQFVRSTSKQDDEMSRDEQKAKKSTSEQKSTPQKSNEAQRSSQQKPPSLERKKSETPSLNSEPLLRQNMKRSLQAILQEKLKEAKASDSTTDFKANPETLAVEIEQELINLFGTAGNPKCKAKFRTLLFNLKNTRSTLATSLLTLSLPPSQLVRMDSSEMAPAELTEWRQRESQRELEAIKRSELDKLTEAKKQELIEKGAEMDVAGKVAVVARQELEGVIPEPEDGKTKHGSTDEKKEDKERVKSKKKKHHRDRKHHHHRDREEASSSRAHEKKSDEKEDDKSLKRSSSVLSEEPKAVWPELPLKEKYESMTQAQFSLTSPRELSPSLPELPSSTVKTPDFSPPQTTSLSPLFKTKLVMPELGSLNASAFNVSHPQLEGTLFPESPVPIVGRISPETVWDYIDKMKKSKELIVLRLAPATPQDADAYMTFFSYLSSRGRLGVLGGISPPLKDVYLVPLDKHSPVNRSLLPFHGPGLPTQRAHCLLAVVTRTIESVHRLRLEVRHPKKPKLESKPESPPAKNEDEDKPYEPWEGEDEEEEEDKVALELRKLNEQIARERQEIESILVATSRNVALAKVGGIPGLDGEFDDAEPEELETKKELEVIEVEDDKVIETKPDEIIEEESQIRIANEPTTKDDKMEIDESPPSPVTIEDSPPTPEPPPPGLDDFRPLKRQSIEELSDEPFEGTSLKHPMGKKIEINIKGVFKAAETSHADIDERQLQPDQVLNENLPGLQHSTDLSLTPQRAVTLRTSLQQIPVPPAEQRQIPVPSAEQPAMPINVSVPPPNPFFMPPGLPPVSPVGLPPQPQPHQLPPRFPMMAVGGGINERFAMLGPQQPPTMQQQPPRFPTNFPPPPMPGMTGAFPPVQQGSDLPSPSSSTRPDRFQTTEPQTSEDPWDGNGQRVPRFSDSPRRHDSPKFGTGSYRHPRGDLHGRVYRNPGGDRGRRWDYDRRNNRSRDRSRSPDRRDRQRRDSRDRSGSRRHRRRSRSSSPRRRTRTPSPRRGSKSPLSRRRSKSPSSRRGSKSTSPKRRSASPHRKSTSPRRRRRSASSPSSSSSSDSK